MGVTSGDVNGDGNIDLFVNNMYSKAGRRVIANLQPGTYQGELLAKLQHSFATGSRMYLNRGNNQFDFSLDAPTTSIGWAFGVSLADFDNDGWLDLYSCSGFVSRNRDRPDG